MEEATWQRPAITRATFVGWPGAVVLWPAFVTCGFPTGQWEGLCLSLPVLHVGTIQDSVVVKQCFDHVRLPGQLAEVPLSTADALNSLRICCPWRKLRESARRKLRLGRSATLPGKG